MADKYLIKGDPSFPHHYIFTVGVKGTDSSNPGQLFMKHGPIYFHHRDLEKLSDAFYRLDDKVFKQTESEALNAEGVYDLVMSILFMRFAAQANQCTTHHLSFESKIDEEYLLTIIGLANKDKETLKTIQDSRIRL